MLGDGVSAMICPIHGLVLLNDDVSCLPSCRAESNHVYRVMVCWYTANVSNGISCLVICLNMPFVHSVQDRSLRLVIVLTVMFKYTCFIAITSFHYHCHYSPSFKLP